MDEIEKRLRETSENCFNCYEVWQKSKKDAAAREGLQEAIHEIRKVASRLEIELAISERDEMAMRPIPIPPHRDAHRRPQENNFEENDSNGNRLPPDDFQAGQNQARPQHPPRQQGGGGGGQGGGPRRNNNRPPRKSADG